MDQFFSANYTGSPFAFLGPAHLVALGCILLLNLILIRFKGSSESTRGKIRISLGIILWINEASYHIWAIANGLWNIQEYLPLHACSILIWLAGFMLIFKNYTIYEFAYFMGIGGAIQALMTPNIGIYGYPHFRFIQTFISHGLLVTSAIYLTVVEGMRPTWKSLLKVMVVLNVYMVIIFFVNKLIGSNYLYVAYKPAGPTLLDVLPAWPWYLIYIEAIGLVVFLLLYIPFIIKDWRAGKSIKA
jgi:hypothetical integral membrane protein (TIGR02206 family)